MDENYKAQLYNNLFLFLCDLLDPDTPPALRKMKTEWETEVGIIMSKSDNLWSKALLEK